MVGLANGHGFHVWCLNRESAVVAPQAGLLCHTAWLSLFAALLWAELVTPLDTKKGLVIFLPLGISVCGWETEWWEQGAGKLAQSGALQKRSSECAITLQTQGSLHHFGMPYLHKVSFFSQKICRENEIPECSNKGWEMAHSFTFVAPNRKERRKELFVISGQNPHAALHNWSSALAGEQD